MSWRRPWNRSSRLAFPTAPRTHTASLSSPSAAGDARRRARRAPASPSFPSRAGSCGQQATRPATRPWEARCGFVSSFMLLLICVSAGPLRPAGGCQRPSNPRNPSRMQVARCNLTKLVKPVTFHSCRANPSSARPSVSTRPRPSCLSWWSARPPARRSSSPSPAVPARDWCRWKTRARFGCPGGAREGGGCARTSMRRCPTMSIRGFEGGR